jgi:hypothetical protein
LNPASTKSCEPSHPPASRIEATTVLSALRQKRPLNSGTASACKEVGGVIDHWLALHGYRSTPAPATKATRPLGRELLRAIRSIVQVGSRLLLRDRSTAADDATPAARPIESRIRR